MTASSHKPSMLVEMFQGPHSINPVIGGLESDAGYRTSNVNGFQNAKDNAFDNINTQAGDPLDFPTSAVTMGIASSSANDTSAGTGARTVLIQGLDESFNEIQEVVTLSGQTKVETSNQYFRINFLQVLTVGSAGNNQGDIWIADTADTFTSGVPSTPVNSITNFWSKSYNSIFTVPAGYSASFGLMRAGCFTNNASFIPRARVVSGAWQRLGFFTLNAGTQIGMDLGTVGKFPTGTDLEIQAAAVTSTARVWALCPIFLLPN